MNTSYFSFVNQLMIKRRLGALAMQGSQTNVLIVGDYGHGKTSIGLWFAGQFVDPARYYAVPAHMPRNSTIFENTVIIDEAHQLGNDEESIYPLLEQKRVILCTPDTASLSAGLTTRCLVMHLETYNIEEITLIIWNYLRDVQLIFDLEWTQAEAIALRAQNNPRIAIHLADEIYRLCCFDQKPLNMAGIAEEFDFLGVDEAGLDDRHHHYLRILRAAGRPIGLAQICVQMNRSKDCIQKEVEPPLLKQGLVIITPRGRMLV